ncbi:MAG TPA: outer membrane protein assembly factor BamD [Alphaproteobacteria bacterium]|nr:outer membrane protein assembly factor BamD [Rhodospirillaceae bacterium]HRJ67546.1 outer membrane protein assembly factor BamD [Alphaproteobacteria bacterium]
MTVFETPQSPRAARLCRLALLVMLSLPLAACATEEEKAAKRVAAEAAQQEPVETLYNRAAQRLDEGAYFDAAKLFDEVDRQYPYSQWATRAQLMSGYSHYRNLKYDEAIMALDRYIELHPGDDSISYAHYLRALCFYEQIVDVRRDQRLTEMALENLQRVVDRFPETVYARDALLKIDLTRDHLAGKEMEIGRYYQERHQHQAAINRFQRVVDKYQTTTHVPEALHRMTESYLALGIPAEANKTAAILGYNFPESRWYKDTYALVGDNGAPPPKKSVYDRTLGKLF